MKSNSQKYNTENNIIKQLNLLREKGREVNLFIDNEVLKVYEIVNESGSSKILDLMF